MGGPPILFAWEQAKDSPWVRRCFWIGGSSMRAHTADLSFAADKANPARCFRLSRTTPRRRPAAAVVRSSCVAVSRRIGRDLPICVVLVGGRPGRKCDTCGFVFALPIGRRKTAHISRSQPIRSIQSSSARFVQPICSTLPDLVSRPADDPALISASLESDRCDAP